MEYGENIKAARKAAGLTQAELAKKCGLATVTVRQYESGKREPRREQMQAIADALGVKVWELMGFDGFIRVPVPEYPLSLPTKEQVDRMTQPELEYYYLRLLADDAPDDLKKRYIENYDKLNKLGQVEAVIRTKELTRLHEYTDADPRKKSGISIMLKKNHTETTLEVNPTLDSPTSEEPPESAENGG